ncbi:MAG: tRNA adenosine deaminase-associated protein [Propionicimonas sp.]|uniref:tRNA adenosine deaminase-associated protein n=1 Tax=Propionicimonas sp. TaxID=1955623 RepID=UPI002B1F9186|nr:tRNA adenosine deaminase-associated protein [Propionicimonas sp.]MEA4945894.1 tRNA adenosine deaminase-associated protein [Propionicimonas sp.]MEA5052963.1 tRNA adenosine deaminase-associated protein [Propionicimonas sp.]
MSGSTGDFELELPNLGDDRAGLEELDDDLELDGPDDDDEDDADESDDDFDDYPEDAAEEDIDLILALYREEGQPVVVGLDLELANDLDALMTQLRRIPGDAGALAMVSLATEVFVLVRVRGKKVQVFLSDAGAAADWPIARDVVDYLGIDSPDEDEDTFPAGDLDILVDAGLPDFELEALASEYDEDSAGLLEQIAKKIKFGPEFSRTVSRSFD